MGLKTITAAAVAVALIAVGCGSSTTPNGAGPTQASVDSGIIAPFNPRPNLGNYGLQVHNENGDAIFNVTVDGKVTTLDCPGSGLSNPPAWVGCELGSPPLNDPAAIRAGLVFCEWIQTPAEHADAVARGVGGAQDLVQCGSKLPKDRH